MRQRYKRRRYDHRSVEPDAATVRLLRDVLESEAGTVMPAGDGLARIREKAERRRQRLRWVHGAEALGAAAAVGVVIGVVTGAIDLGFGSDSDGRDSATHVRTLTTAPPTALPSASASAEPQRGPLREVTVFYVGSDDGHPAIFAELHQRPRPEAAAVIRDAVQAMLTEPPNDPSYSSPWPSGVEIRGISQHGDLVVVDLSSRAADGPKGLGAVAAQQLRNTVRSAVQGSGEMEVALRIETVPQRSLWGDLIARDHGSDGLVITSDDMSFAPLQILAPAWGSSVDGNFTFGGTARVFEGTVSWEVLASDGSLVKQGHTTASTGAPASGTWWVQETLPTGTYTLRAFESSAKDGSPLHATTKQFSVK
jgi:hypothetical protein